ncbi:MAG TPA: hypothetical protein PK225_12170 [Azonexus sp.]|jgi:hypothetical protein|nr:hypothetical protein [Azonexus sp.]
MRWVSLADNLAGPDQGTTGEIGHHDRLQVNDGAAVPSGACRIPL